MPIESAYRTSFFEILIVAVSEIFASRINFQKFDHDDDVEGEDGMKRDLRSSS